MTAGSFQFLFYFFFARAKSIIGQFFALHDKFAVPIPDQAAGGLASGAAGGKSQHH